MPLQNAATECRSALGALNLGLCKAQDAKLERHQVWRANFYYGLIEAESGLANRLFASFDDQSINRVCDSSMHTLSCLSTRVNQWRIT